ncbi:MAG: PAS domain S-box protein [Deltaproteobacteria bacterium]|nr:PAS domain S-box protein [Deltaproteobacteria bacterium]
MNQRPTLSDERYKAFIENINDGIYELDIHGNFTYFNNALCEVLGFPREEIQFQNFSKFMNEKRANAAFEVFNRIFKTGKGISDLMWKIIDKAGNSRRIELSANLVKNSEGAVVGFRGIAHDVTDKFRTLEALRRSELRYRTLLDFVPYPIVVFSQDGRVFYLNPSFSETFGWTFEELKGKRIPYVPSDMKQDVSEGIRKLFEEKLILRHETRRLTKDGRTLDVVMRAALFTESEDDPAGELVILRDITLEKRMAKNNEAMLRISRALPEHPDLEDLLDFVSGEVKQLLNSEGALVILLDQEKNELFFQGAAYDDTATIKRVKEIRFPIDKLVAGQVIKTGQPIIVSDASKDPELHRERDEKLGYHTKNLLQVPLRSSDRIIGTLCAINKKDGAFEQRDVELLNMVAGTVVLSIENARFSEELKSAYREVSGMNRVKDKVINHLSHELKTPGAVLSASLNILERRLAPLLREDAWKPAMERAKRNLGRLLDIQYQVEDIVRDREYKTHAILSLLLDECTDEIEALAAEEVGQTPLVQRIGQRVEEIFGPRDSVPTMIGLNEYAEKRLEKLRKASRHRNVDVTLLNQPAPQVCLPPDVLDKIFDGLVKNAVENTPDEGKIEIRIQKSGEGTELIVQDFGVGITTDNQRRIFEGFFTTQETLDYSSKRPFDFNAGGKGADLLRMKIFSERYNFKIDLHSARCGGIPEAGDKCPGKISDCEFCKQEEDCLRSGQTTFRLYFPPASASDCQ